MSVFGRRKKLELTCKQEELSQRMADRICLMQQRMASYLNERTAGFGRGIWLLVLGVLCLLMGGYCAYLLIKVFI